MSGDQISRPSPRSGVGDASHRARSARSAGESSTPSFSAITSAARFAFNTTAAVSGNSLAGRRRARVSGAPLRCVAGSILRMLSISSPNHSTRIGACAPAGKQSRIPPRRAYSPRPPTSGTRSYPSAATRSVASSSDMRVPGRRERLPSTSAVGSALFWSAARSEVTRMRVSPLPHAASAATRPADSSTTSSPRSYGSELRGSSSVMRSGSALHARSESATRSATSGLRAIQTSRASRASAAPSTPFAACGTWISDAA